MKYPAFDLPTGRLSFSG